MLDPKILRQNLEHVVEKLRRRGFEMDSDTFLQLENKRKEAQLAIQSFQTKRNQYQNHWNGEIKRGKPRTLNG